MELETCNRNVCLPFITEVGTSQILNKLRRTKKKSVSFLPSTESDLGLNDADASHFFRSETINFEHVFNLCHLFEFLT
jgi:hypothetical protein